MPELALLFGGQAVELMSNEIFVLGNDLLEQVASTRSQGEIVGAAALASLNQTAGLHAVNELTNITLGDQKRVGQFLLSQSVCRAHVRQDVKLSHGQAVLPHVFGGGAVDVMEDAGQTQPGQNARPADSLVYLFIGLHA